MSLLLVHSYLHSEWSLRVQRAVSLPAEAV
jgi:hypothetical protein